MFLYDSEYNKRKNQFEEGIRLIRKRNNRFFLNTRQGNSMYDPADIHSYFTIYEYSGQPELSFRANGGLPEPIMQDIQALFQTIWGVSSGQE